jgi:CCR4-NOT transcription complex subunit 1
MDPNRQIDSIGAISPGVGSGVSPSNGADSSAGIANILQDIGPACTRSARTLRDTLAEITPNTSNLNEPAIARIVYFFSDKGRDADGSALMGVSSGLLGSLMPGRGNEVSADGWNLTAVAQVLEQDYGSLDWAAVASFFDFPGFAIKDAEQFRAMIELYTAGAKRPPPLTAFTSLWRNAAGQLSFIESMAVSQNIYACPLSEAEAEDAATAAQATNGMDPRCFASMEILLRLLFLSDIPALYRRVRDLFVKGLLSCPEVLLCSLVRLQLHVANTPVQPGRENLTNAGMQIKTEIMRELIPLFFRPNARHRVQNAPSALRQLYSISPITVTVACFEAWRSTANERPQVALATLMHTINIARLLPSPADAVKSLLDGSKDAEFSIAIAFVMADNEYLQLKPWLVEKFSQKATAGVFAAAILGYIAKTHGSAAPRGGDGEGATLVSLENIAISLQISQALDASILSQTFPTSDGQGSGASLGDNLKAVIEACISAHPSLRTSLVSQGINAPGAGSSPRGNTPSPGASDDVEEMATAYFQKIYTSEQSIGEVVEMLKRFKMSGNAKENEIFACMVHNLFDEYRFFSKYPEKELRITGILFGTLIQEQLVSSITLGIALRYVLEALRKPPSPTGTSSSSGKMFQFGMFALEQFKGRLHEWPQYCSHIVQIPHLKDGYAELVSEIENAMLESQNRVAGQTNTPSGTSAAGSAMAKEQSAPSSYGSSQDTANALNVPSSTNPSSVSLELPSAVLPADAEPRIAEFGPLLGRAVTELGDDDKEFESPTDSVLDRVQFLVNNLAPANVEKKAQELKDMLEPKFFGWLGQYLVVKRISTQANFHSLYLNFLDQLGEYGKGLVEAILESVYQNIGKLLRSPKITTSSSERSYLKNLGIWLGQITLARNRPILQIMLDCKELLLQGYETGKLIAVAPFLAKTLEGAKNSIIFRRPNPWLMGLLGVFRSVYNVEGLKMNIKFEVEVLCKNLNIKLEDIPLKTMELQKRVAPIKERNPDFNIKSVAKIQAAASGQFPGNTLGTPDVKVALGMPGDINQTGGDDQETVIPNLAAYVTINPSLSQLLQQPSQSVSSVLSSLTSASLKRSVPVAVDRAIREIIQPVVERSVTIACITTKEIVTKDFAMESDENRMRKAGQLMVANLAGSLALVTCREPLRSSVSTHLRQLLTANAGGAEKLNEQEQNVIEQCVQICATDNLELGCMLIEKAATEKAVRDVDEDLSLSLNARRKHREQTGQPFYDMSIFGNGNQRYPAALPEQLRPKPGGLRNEHFQLYDSFQRLARQTPTPGAINAPGTALNSMVPGAAGPNITSEIEASASQKPGTGAQLGIDALSTVAAKLDSAVSALLSAAGPRAPEIKLPMLPPDHQILQLLAAVKQILPNLNPNGGVTRNLAANEQEAVLGFSQGIFKRLYELNLSEPLRLEALVALLENINVSCPKLGKDIGTWATYAPTNTEGQRRLHRTVLLLLIRGRLLAVNDLDVFLAARADNGRNHIWVEFSLLFIRTAFLERISMPSDFPKLIELMTRIAEGISQASPQIMQTYRKPILRMLEETHGLGASNVEKPSNMAAQQGPSKDSSSLSSESLSNMAAASKKVAEATEGFIRNDPPNSKQQVTTLLDNWIRLHAEAAGNEKVYTQFLQYLQQGGVGKVEEQTERFLRLSVLLVVDAVSKTATNGNNGSRMLNYTVIDVYSRLLVLMFKQPMMGGGTEKADAQRLNMLNKLLGVIVRCMMFDAETANKSGARAWDQRPWFRIFLNLLMDMTKPDPTLEPIKLGVLSVFGAAFHVCQPLALPGTSILDLRLLTWVIFNVIIYLLFPGFSFSWFELVSHRHFLPNLLLVEGRKGWNIAHQLLVDYFLFLEPHLSKQGEMTPPMKKFYEGTLRVLLVLLHDFPSFLAAYHLSLCNVIPDNCIQLRNLVLSASPKGMIPPDPFTPNLKIDLLPEIQQSPFVLSNVLGPIEGIRNHLDAFLKEGGQRTNFLVGLPTMLCREGTNDVDPPKVNSLVMYIGIHALARLQSSQISLARISTPEMDVLLKLMDFDDRGRYICLNAIANQLRYPSSHTHYFSCVMLYLFSESKNIAVKEQVTRVLLERLILHRPHPWGLLVTFIELIKNQAYGFWNYPFTRCATEIEKVFESVARSCMPPASQHTTVPVAAGGDE